MREANVAETLATADTVQVPVPEQAPPQPENDEEDGRGLCRAASRRPLAEEGAAGRAAVDPTRAARTLSHPGDRHGDRVELGTRIVETIGVGDAEELVLGVAPPAEPAGTRQQSAHRGPPRTASFIVTRSYPAPGHPGPIVLASLQPSSSHRPLLGLGVEPVPAAGADDTPPAGQEQPSPSAQVYGGCSGRIIGFLGGCEKSNSEARLPRIFSFSRTSGRGSGRPSVFGSGGRRRGSRPR